MTERDFWPESRWRFAAWLWFAAVLLMSSHLAWLGWVVQPRPDSDVMALLPRDARDPLAETAFARMSASAERRVVVLLGARDVASAKRAADAYLPSLTGIAAEVRHKVAAADLARWRSELSPYRGGLLGEAGRSVLALSPDKQADHALSRLFSPASAGGLPWREDPFGFFTSWMMELSGGQNVRSVDGRLWISAEGREWAVILLEMRDGAFSLAAQQALMPRLADGAARARAASGGIEVLTAGIAPIAAVVARDAQNELSAIGVGSTLGVLLLVLLVFRRPGAVILSLFPLAVGTLAAISVTSLVFAKVHVLTLVFGASLIGVGVDYGVHFLAAGIGESPFAPKRRRDDLNYGLWLAMITTVVAYLALALTPFPGLRQMAVFSGAGLVAAWLTVILWFPYLQRRPTHGTGIGAWMAHLRSTWPVFGKGLAGRAIALIVVAVLVAGFAKFEIRDDIRALQAVPTALLLEQGRVAKLAGLPSPAQFFIVRGPSSEAVLQREEALLARLSPLVADGTLSSVQATASHLPSAARQKADCARLRAAYADPVWRKRVGEATGFDPAALVQPDCRPLTQEGWQALPASEAFRALWLGRVEGDEAGVVLLGGLKGQAALARVAAAGQGLAGVSWVDKPARISAVLAHYRFLMSLVVVLGYLASVWLLWRRFGVETWRSVLPTVIASALAVAALGLAGLPFQLFAVLGLFIVLGMGVDYGIFLLEHPRVDDGRPWLAATLSALSTLLSFGLLALSGTPALRVFGLTCLVGVGGAWLLSPCFARRSSR